MTPTTPDPANTIPGFFEALTAILTTLFVFFSDFFRQGLAAFLF